MQLAGARDSTPHQQRLSASKVLTWRAQAQRAPERMEPGICRPSFSLLSASNHVQSPIPRPCFPEQPGREELARRAPERTKPVTQPASAPPAVSAASASATPASRGARPSPAWGPPTPPAGPGFPAVSSASALSTDAASSSVALRSETASHGSGPAHAQSPQRPYSGLWRCVFAYRTTAAIEVHHSL